MQNIIEIEELVRLISRLPGLGPKSAKRIVLKLINTRDEPHADPLKYRRLHVIVGDANLCEVATFLKLGTTGIVMAMIEDDFLDNRLKIADPVYALSEVSRDISLEAPIRLENGKTATALSLQWELF